jgi:hypothetical protein
MNYHSHLPGLEEGKLKFPSLDATLDFLDAHGQFDVPEWIKSSVEIREALSFMIAWSGSVMRVLPNVPRHCLTGQSEHTINHHSAIYLMARAKRTIRSEC